MFARSKLRRAASRWRCTSRGRSGGAHSFEGVVQHRIHRIFAAGNPQPDSCPRNENRSLQRAGRQRLAIYSSGHQEPVEANREARSVRVRELHGPVHRGGHGGPDGYPVRCA